MKPYYQDEAVTLYHGDAFDLIDEWTHGDVMVTDPPYGMRYVSNRTTQRTAPIVGDSDTEARDTAIATWGDRPALVFGTWRCPRPAAFRHLLIWDKGDDPGTGDLTMPWGNSCEEVYVLGKGFTGKRRANVLRHPTDRGATRPDHPTPKPVALMADLIHYCPPGVVADPFAGSGATLRAAKNLGRRAIGVEIDERYCEVIARRLGQEVLDFGGAA